MPGPIPFSRRSLIAGASMLGAFGSARAATAPAPARSGPVLAYIGSYTDASTPAGNGEGITVLRLDTGTGELKPVKTLPNPSPSWLATGPDRKFLYAVNETADYGPNKTGSVTAFGIDEPTGDLRLLNAASSAGKGPAHGSVHPSGKFFLVANYGTGNVAVLPVQANGMLGEAVDVKQDDGPHGETRPAEGPPGNFSISDHNGPHAHMIASDPTGRFVIVNDLGLDRTFVWTLDAATGKLAANDPPFIPAASAGAGPRHFAFHPNGRIFYNLYEEASQLAVYDWNPRYRRRHAEAEGDDGAGLCRHELHLGARRHPGWPLHLYRQPPAQQHRHLRDRGGWEGALARRGMDARRLSPQHRARSHRQLHGGVQPPQRPGDGVPRGPAHRGPALHRTSMSRSAARR